MNQKSPNLNRSWEESQQIIKNLEAKITQLEAKKEAKSCQCHIIDANKVSVLMWAEKGSQQLPTKCPGCACHAQNFLLKQANQKLRGLIRTDKHRNIYWKFRNVEEEVLDKPTAKIDTPKCSNCQVEVEIIGQRDKSTPLLCYTCSQKEIIDRLAARKAELAQNQAQNTNPAPKVEPTPELNNSPTQESVKENHANQ